MWTQTPSYADLADELFDEGEIEPPLGSHSADDRAYLLLLYREHAAQARQQETLRSMWTAAAFAVIVGLVAWGAVEAGRREWIAGTLVCCAALIGAALNQKHFERYELHLSIMRSFRNALAMRVRHDIPKLTIAASIQHGRRFKMSRRFLGLQGLWRTVYAGAFVAGLAMVWIGVDEPAAAALAAAGLGQSIGASMPDHMAIQPTH